jgi:hypothetical protein
VQLKRKVACGIWPHEAQFTCVVTVCNFLRDQVAYIWAQAQPNHTTQHHAPQHHYHHAARTTQHAARSSSSTQHAAAAARSTQHAGNCNWIQLERRSRRPKKNKPARGPWGSSKYGAWCMARMAHGVVGRAGSWEWKWELPEARSPKPRRMQHLDMVPVPVPAVRY